MFKSKTRGFTLVEILIAIGIMGLLFTIIMVSMQRARQSAKITKAMMEVGQIFKGISLLEMDSEQWPGHKMPYQVDSGASGNEICPDGCAYGLSDCQSGLACNDTINPYPYWNGPYMKVIPKDPWGNEYFFDTDYDIDPGAGQEWAVVVGSYGPDGIGNNQYNSDDILYIIVKE